MAALLLAGIVYVVPRTNDQPDTATDVVAAEVLEATTAASESAADAPDSAAQGANGASETDSGTDGGSPDAADSSTDDAPAAREESGEGESRSLDTAGTDEGDLADAPEDPPETESATVFVDPGDDGADAADDETTETTVVDAPSGETMLLGSIAGGLPSAEELIASLGDRVEDRQGVIDYFMSGGSVGVDARNTRACGVTLPSWRIRILKKLRTRVSG